MSIEESIGEAGYQYCFQWLFFFVVVSHAAREGKVLLLALSCSVGDHDKEEQPLETILVACLANTLLNRHVMSCEMVWAKERQ